MKKLVFLLLFMSLISFANAQWWQTSLNQGYIMCLANSGNNIFAGGSGIYFSTNNGGSWSDISISYYVVKSLTVSNNEIFAATDRGIYLSTNNGSSWSAKNTGLTDSTNVQALALIGNNVFAGSHLGVFLSTNNGNSWDSINTGLTGYAHYVNALAISGSNVFAGTYDGVYLSSNNGANWDSVNTGLTGIARHIISLAISDTNIIAATSNGVYLSSINGSNWVNLGLIGFPIAIRNDTILAGITNDGSGGGVFVYRFGNTWVNTGLADTINALEIIGSAVFAGTNRGVWVFPLYALGIEETKDNESNMSVYPNPSNNYLIIETPPQSTIKISNIQGKLIKTLNADDTKTNVDVSAFPSGMYIVEVKSEKGVGMRKFIKE